LHPLLLSGSQPHGAPGSTSIILAKREANAKWLRVRPPVTETKQHVTHYAQSVTDEPFLNRVSQKILLGKPPTYARISARQQNRPSIYGQSARIGLILDIEYKTLLDDSF
jgi:hypothetical protein